MLPLHYTPIKVFFILGANLLTCQRPIQNKKPPISGRSLISNRSKVRGSAASLLGDNPHYYYMDHTAVHPTFSFNSSYHIGSCQHRQEPFTLFRPKKGKSFNLAQKNPLIHRNWTRGPMEYLCSEVACEEGQRYKNGT